MDMYFLTSSIKRTLIDTRSWIIYTFAFGRVEAVLDESRHTRNHANPANEGSTKATTTNVVGGLMVIDDEDGDDDDIEPETMSLRWRRGNTSALPPPSSSSMTRAPTLHSTLAYATDDTFQPTKRASPS